MGDAEQCGVLLDCFYKVTRAIQIAPDLIVRVRVYWVTMNLLYNYIINISLC